MKLEIDVSEHEIEQLAVGSQSAAAAVGKELAKRATIAAHNLWGSAMCVCGHTRHWHGQEPRQPRGSGACDDCACEKFEREVSA